MKVSVITACFNSESVILDAILSVESQVGVDVEHIFIDGASTDETLEIIRNNAIEKHRVVSEADDGIYDAFNKGLSVATGDIVGFLHSDDVYLNKDFLKTVVQQFEDPLVDLTYSDLVYFSGDWVDRRVVRRWKSAPFVRRQLAYGWMAPHPTVFVRSAVQKKVGLYKTDFKIASDYDMILRLFQSAGVKAKYANILGVGMRLGGASNKDLQSIIRKSREDYRILKSNNFRWPLLVVILKNIRKISQIRISPSRK